MRRSKIWIGLLVLALALSGSAPWAEVSGETGRGIVYHIVDDGDPLTFLIWKRHTIQPEEWVLNADGFERQDGPPDFAYNRSGEPIAVWAYNRGQDKFDIALSHWEGERWSEIEFLTNGEYAGPLDPRIEMAPDGSLHVAWWDSDEHDVFYSRRPVGEDWSNPVQVDPQGDHLALRPDLSFFNGGVYIAYEQWVATDTKQIYVAKEAPHLYPDLSFSYRTIGSVVQTRSLRLLLHSNESMLWLDWVRGLDELESSYLQPDGEWSSPELHDWPDQNWVGLEDARRRIQRHVAGSLAELPTAHVQESGSARDMQR